VKNVTPTAEDVALKAACIIDPDAFHAGLPKDGTEIYWSVRRAKAYVKARSILAVRADDVGRYREALTFIASCTMTPGTRYNERLARLQERMVETAKAALNTKEGESRG
jgi:hypothetical protein